MESASAAAILALCPSFLTSALTSHGSDDKGCAVFLVLEADPRFLGYSFFRYITSALGPNCRGYVPSAPEVKFLATCFLMPDPPLLPVHRSYHVSFQHSGTRFVLVAHRACVASQLGL